MKAEPMSRVLPLIPVLLAMAGCASNNVLTPASGAQSTDVRNAAIDDVQGVTMLVNARPWPGYPELLEIVTPVHVTIRNESSHPLEVRYRDFNLQTGSGFVTHALPPYRVHGTVPPTRWEPAFDQDGFYIAPYDAGFYPGFPVWGAPFEYDDAYDSHWYPYWHEQLPTRDMLAHAIPEGVLKPGGHISGFLYFPQSMRDVKTVDFSAALIDAGTRRTFGSVRIPFDVTG
jgi:hypothetical protein